MPSEKFAEASANQERRKKKKKKRDTMTVEAIEKKKKIVLVGIRVDSHSRELLNWAIVKVAEPGDQVVAVHVSQGCTHSLIPF